MNAFARKHWPPVSVIGIYWLAVATLLLIASHTTQGLLIYPLDDSYIHMAIAKNTVLHHVWGPTRHEFTSSTSTPLWISLLALTYSVFGVSEAPSLILNLLFGTLAILASYLFLAKYVTSRLKIFVALLVVLFVTPLPALTLTGMEHVLHALLTLFFVYLSVQILSATTKPLRRHYLLLMLLAPLVTMVRYEGLFLVFVVCVLLLCRRMVFYAATLGMTALSPVIAYGIWSTAHGWHFLPNSILLKGEIPRMSLKGAIKFLGYGALYKIESHPHILFLLIASSLLLLFFYFKKDKADDDKKYANLIFLGCLLLHMEFTTAGSFFRYEAYLVLLGIVVLSIAASDFLPKRREWKFDRGKLPHYALAILLIAVIAFPFVSRARRSLINTPQAMKNVYEQQYQMALFIKKFYQGRTIALNDIGAVSYLADIHLLDLWGLASLEPARLRLLKCYDTQQIYNLSERRGAVIAIAYDSWFETDKIGGLPRQWVKIGQWTIPNNVVCGAPTVSLYAVDPSASDELIRNLKEFTTELPADVEQYGKYTEM